MPRPTSYSQNMMFQKCRYGWYQSYIKKVPVLTDMSAAYAGNVLHKTLQTYYDGDITELDKLKAFFNNQWEQKNLKFSTGYILT